MTHRAKQCMEDASPDSDLSSSASAADSRCWAVAVSSSGVGVVKVSPAVTLIRTRSMHRNMLSLSPSAYSTCRHMYFFVYEQSL